MERFFKSFKQWQRLTLLAMSTTSLQRRLDSLAPVYIKAWMPKSRCRLDRPIGNIHRPHSALGIRTPQEAFTGKVLRATTEEFIPARRNARDGPNIQIEIARRKYRGDPHLPIIDIRVRRAA